MPQDPGAFLGFLQDSTSVIDGIAPGSIVVHSSEGITGTFIVIDILLNLIAYQGEDKCVYVCPLKIV